MADTDAAIIAAAMQAPNLFGAIFDRHASAVLRFFVRRVGPNEAGGLVGEVFRIAFERRASFDPTHIDALPWLYGIATRQLANYRRSQSRRLEACARFAAERNGVELKDSAMESQLVLRQLATELESLPDGERQALLLFALEELSYEAIAAALDIPIGTVRSRINRARRRLQSALKGGDVHDG